MIVVLSTRKFECEHAVNTGVDVGRLTGESDGPPPFPGGSGRTWGWGELYEFIRTHLASDLPRMKPLDVVNNPEVVSCLGEPGRGYLIYMSSRSPGDPSRGLLRGAFHLDLTDAPGRFDAKWIGLSLGTVFDAYGGSLEGGKVLSLGALDWRPWLLWLKQRGE